MFMITSPLFQCYSDKIKNAVSDTVFDGFPGKLTPMEKSLCLIDVGYFVNNSGPPLLKPERNVDVIIAVDYDYDSIFKVRRIGISQRLLPCWLWSSEHPTQGILALKNPEDPSQHSRLPARTGASLMTK